MTRTEAQERIEESFARESATPSIGAKDRDAYVEEQKAKLRACLIDPVPVTAIASDWAQRYGGQTSEVRKMVALAHSDGKWLLYDEATGDFATANGAAVLGGPLSLLGFQSKDALAEWLG